MVNRCALHRYTTTLQAWPAFSSKACWRCLSIFCLPTAPYLFPPPNPSTLGCLATARQPTQPRVLLFKVLALPHIQVCTAIFLSALFCCRAYGQRFTDLTHAHSASQSLRRFVEVLHDLFRNVFRPFEEFKGAGFNPANPQTFEIGLVDT